MGINLIYGMSECFRSCTKIFSRMVAHEGKPKPRGPFGNSGVSDPMGEHPTAQALATHLHGR
jgi:hypothetical protein